MRICALFVHKRFKRFTLSDNARRISVNIGATYALVHINEPVSDMI